MRVLLDSNLFLAPSDLRMGLFRKIEDILGRVHFVTIRPVVDELSKLSRRKIQVRRTLRSALEMVAKCEILEVETGGETVDDVIVRVAYKERLIVATLDSRLRRRLRRANVPVIYLRQNRLVCEPAIAEYG